MKLAIILLLFCFLAGCSETVYLRNDEEPVLVLNAVLEARSDSMRIELTETKGAYDQSPWQRFPEAEVRVYEEGELLGTAEYQPADSAFVLRQPVKAERTYRIEARVAGKGTVWGETRVPEEVADCHAELWFEHKGWGHSPLDCPLPLEGHPRQGELLLVYSLRAGLQWLGAGYPDMACAFWFGLQQHVARPFQPLYHYR